MFGNLYHKQYIQLANRCTFPPLYVYGFALPDPCFRVSASVEMV